MNKKVLLLILLAILPLLLKAQKITITLADEANKKYAFILNKGTKKDTIQSGILNFAGNATILIPNEDKDYVGMGSLEVEASKSVNMIVSKGDFRVTKQRDSGDYIFTNSPENDFLYAYILQKEIKPIANSKLYASRFIELVAVLSRVNNVVYGNASLSERTSIKLYVTNELKMEDLYTSSLWYNMVDGLTKMNANEDNMAKDMIRIVDRIKSQEVLIHFTENLITITQQFGMDKAYDSIISHIKDSNIIATPQGEVYDAFQSMRARAGSVAPAVVGLIDDNDSKYTKTLLVFYQPDCQSCEAQMKILISKHKELEGKGVRIVSISSDHDKAVFGNDMKKFPWKDKLCDFEGYAGPNFINFGVMGTPTYYLLDKNKVIIGRYSMLDKIQF